jgi:hypothetical protein
MPEICAEEWADVNDAIGDGAAGRLLSGQILGLMPEHVSPEGTLFV